MKFIVNYQDFKKALKKVSLFSSKDSSLPFFTKSVYIGKPNDHQVCLGCTDIETIGETNVDVIFDEHSDDKPTAVEIKKLSQILTAVKPDQAGNISVQVIQNGQRMDQFLIMGERGHVEISCSGPEVVTSLYSFILKGLERFLDKKVVAAEGFFQAVNAVRCCSSTDEARPVLQGLKLGEAMAATDGYRIGKNPVSYEGVDCILSVAFLAKASRLFGKGVGIALDKETNKTIAISDDRSVVAAQLIDGSFPDYNAIIPRTWWMKSTVDRAQLLDALRLTEKVQKVFNGSNVGKFNFEGTDSLVVTTSIEGEGLCDIPLNVLTVVDESTEFKLPFMIAFNVRMLREIVNHVQGEKVVLKCHANNRPLVVTSDQEGAQPVYVLMPMHLG